MRWEHLQQQEDRLVQASGRHETVIIILQHFHSFSKVLISLGQGSNDGVKQKGLVFFLC